MGGNNKFIVPLVILSMILLAALFVFLIKPVRVSKPEQIPIPSENPLIKTTEGVVLKVEDKAAYVKEDFGQELRLEVMESTKVFLQTVSIPKAAKQASGSAVLLSTLISTEDYDYNKIKANDRVKIALYDEGNKLKAQTITVYKEVK